jgi:hypothetical protein
MYRVFISIFFSNCLTVLSDAVHQQLNLNILEHEGGNYMMYHISLILRHTLSQFKIYETGIFLMFYGI